MEAAEPKRREVPPLLLLHFNFVASLNVWPGLAWPGPPMSYSWSQTDMLRIHVIKCNCVSCKGC